MHIGAPQSPVCSRLPAWVCGAGYTYVSISRSRSHGAICNVTWRSGRPDSHTPGHQDSGLALTASAPSSTGWTDWSWLRARRVRGTLDGRGRVPRLPAGRIHIDRYILMLFGIPVHRHFFFANSVFKYSGTKIDFRYRSMWLEFGITQGPFFRYCL